MITATYTENRKKRKVVLRNYRHWGVTFALLAIAAINTVAMLVYGLGAFESVPSVAPWIYLLFAVFSAANLACTAAIYRWRKWGFWGVCAVSLLSLLTCSLLHIYDIGSSFSGLFGCLLLYGALQHGGTSSGWRQLK